MVFDAQGYGKRHLASTPNGLRLFRLRREEKKRAEREAELARESGPPRLGFGSRLSH